MKIPIDIKTGSLSQNVAPQHDWVVGIDLGTTNSLIAIADDKGIPHILKDENGNAVVPSVIHFFSDGNYTVGSEAKSHLGTEPRATLYSIKRLMGKSYMDLEADSKSLGYSLMQSSAEEGLVKVEVNGRYYTPIELSSFILKKLADQASAALGKKVTKAVVTVPAYFNDAQRQATRDAGKLAGLDVLRIVNEPTAASLAYGLGLDKSKNETIVVYDLGGGTFDVSILNIENGIFEVMATKGDTYLGGDDFDQAIVNYWLSKYKSDISADVQPYLYELKWIAEAAKIFLSDHNHYSALWRGIHLEMSRQQADVLFQPLVHKTMILCHEAIKEAGVETARITNVVMVGGSTRVPAVKDAVKSFFGAKVHDEVNPDEVVALGAAVQADILAGNRKDLLLLDVTPLSLGIETLGGLMDVIVPRNTKVPARMGRNYTTSADGQKNLSITVYQGERDLVKYNRKLGSFVLKNLPPMPAGLPKIEVVFALDADGILTVKAKELRSETAMEVTIKSAYGISDEEMARLLLESIQQASADMQEKQKIEAVNEANAMIASVEKFIQINNGILGAEEISGFQVRKENLLLVLEKGNRDDILNAIRELNEFSLPFAHRAMDEAVGNALAGKKIG